MKLSIVIPVLNSEKTLGECLDAILQQDYPRNCYEIVVADAGSSDATLEIARSRGVDIICKNPLKTGEAGKAAGIEVSSGELIALIDSDNILPGPGWMAKMLAPFEEQGIFASEPIRYSARDCDAPLVRYFALLGMNDPVCLFAGNYDRFSAATGKWTGLDVPVERRDGYLRLKIKDQIPTIGANGFVFSRKILDKVSWRPYFFDIDVAAAAIAAGCGDIAKTDTSIVHLYCPRFPDFIRKQRRRICDFLYFSKAKERTYPWKRQKKTGILFFILSAAFIVPLVVQSILFAIRVPPKDRLLALWHLPVCYATLLIYSAETLKYLLGFKPAMADRSAWQKP